MSTPSEVVATRTVDPSARFQRIESPVNSPGSCATCGKSSHPEGFLFLGLDFEFFGTLYFCGDCVGDIARTFGYLSPVEIAGVRDHIAAQDLELNTLRQAVLGLESTVDGLIGDAHRRSTQRADTIRLARDERKSDDALGRPVDQQDEESTDGNVGEPTPSPAVAEPRPDEQVAKRGRNDLLDTSDADELLGL